MHSDVVIVGGITAKRDIHRPATAGSAMTIELLYFHGCPSHAAFLPRLRELLAQAGVDAPIEQRQVQTDADAQRERFLGSPTLRIDGVDVDPDAGERTDYGLRCRLYPVAGGLRGVPPDEWVLAALRRRQ
jgi:hypothetical protein